MGAIYQIEDHETLVASVTENVLRETKISLDKYGSFDEEAYQELIQPYTETLPEVTVRLGDWLRVCPTGIVQKVKQYTGEMAGGMADWVKKDWFIETKEDLDD